MAHAQVIPLILLVHANADQVRHDFSEPVIVISLHPDNFDLAFRVGEFADVSEKFPVLFLEAAEIQVGKNIAQQNQAAIAVLLQNVEASRARLISAPRCRSERISVS